MSKLLSLLAIAMFIAPALIQAGEFPDSNTDCPDDTPTGAVMKVLFPNGQEIEVNLYDPHTIIGRSDPFTEGDADDDGAPVCGAGAAPYPDMLENVPDACFRPTGWLETPSTRREVHTEILSFVLQGGGVTIKAGQPYYDAVAGTDQERFFRYSTGEVSSEYAGNPVDVTKDFTANSYFNVYCQVEIDLPFFKHKLYNKDVMLLRSKITQFPPDFGLPSSTYIHDPNFPPVPLYDSTGKLICYLTSAGHGSPDSTTVFPHTPKPDPWKCPIHFCVDATSAGLSTLATGVSPNDVNFNHGTLQHPMAVYLSSGQNVGQGPDMSNVMDVIPDIGFAAGDKMLSFSYGEDGTLRPHLPPDNCTSLPGALYFSVGRNSTGATCTAVYQNSTGVLVQVTEAAADVYSSKVNAFGSYRGHGGIHPPALTNVTAVDNVQLGLAPMNVNQITDNVTGLDLDRRSNSYYMYTTTSAMRIYATFDGPSFTNSNANIYTVDLSFNTLDPSNLELFATPQNMGLQQADVIDAMSLSDVTPTQLCPAQANGTRDANLDEVLFSLAPGSPTLTNNGYSAADVFYSDFDGSFSLFASHSVLGLLSSDDIDAVDIKPISVPYLRYNVTSAEYCPDSSMVNVTFNAVRTGGRYPFTIALAPGSDPLPTGWTLDATTGNINGNLDNPTNGPVDIIVRVTDFDNYIAETTLTINILSGPTCSYTSPSVVIVGTFASITPTVTGGTPPYWFTEEVGTLPLWLWLDPWTGEIYGETETTGTTVVEIGCYDSCNGFTSCSIEIISVTYSGLVVGVKDLNTSIVNGMSMSTRVRPNPSDQFADIELNMREAATVEIVLYDARGRRVMQLFRGERSAGDHSFRLNSAALEPGQYYYSVITPTESIVNTIVIVR